MSPLPLFKLGVLAIRQLAKPLATKIKTAAKDSDAFRAGCIQVAQFYHAFSINARRRVAGLAPDTNVKPLSEEKAVEWAADALGEAVLYGVAAGALVFEYTRGRINDAEKERQKAVRRQEFEEDQAAWRAAQTEQNERVERMLRELEDRVHRVERGSGYARRPSPTVPNGPGRPLAAGAGEGGAQTSGAGGGSADAPAAAGGPSWFGRLLGYKAPPAPAGGEADAASARGRDAWPRPSESGENGAGVPVAAVPAPKQLSPAL